MARTYVCQDCGIARETEQDRGRLPLRCPECLPCHRAERDRARVRSYDPESRTNSARCAGGCGRTLWGGPTSLAAGERCCRACRAARRSAVTVSPESAADLL